MNLKSFFFFCRSSSPSSTSAALRHKLSYPGPWTMAWATSYSDITGAKSLFMSLVWLVSLMSSSVMWRHRENPQSSIQNLIEKVSVFTLPLLWLRSYDDHKLGPTETGSDIGSFRGVRYHAFIWTFPWWNPLISIWTRWAMTQRRRCCL